MDDPRGICSHRARQRDEELRRARRIERTISWSRLLAVLLLAVLAWLSIQQRLLPLPVALLPGLVFLALIVVHERLARRVTLLERCRAFYREAIARLDGDWREGGREGTRLAAEHAGHLYASDLDLFGPGSLFQMLSRSRTRGGDDLLASWLLAPASPEVVRRRQEAVNELAPRLDFRERLAVRGVAARSELDPAALEAWAERDAAGNLPGSSSRSVDTNRSPGRSRPRRDRRDLGLRARTPPGLVSGFLERLISSSRNAGRRVGGAAARSRPERWAPEPDQAGKRRTVARTLLTLVAAVNVLTLAGWISWGWGPTPFLVAAVLEILWSLRARPRLAAAVDGVARASRDLNLLGALLETIERERFESPLLAELAAELRAEDGTTAATGARRLRRLVDLHDSMRNALFAPFGLLLLWRPHVALAIGAWRSRYGARVGAWLRVVAEVEALASLASYAFEHPRDTFPTVVAPGGSRRAVFEGKGLGHPLLPESTCVGNDVVLFVRDEVRYPASDANDDLPADAADAETESRKAPRGLVLDPTSAGRASRRSRAAEQAPQGLAVEVRSADRAPRRSPETGKPPQGPAVNVRSADVPARQSPAARHAAQGLIVSGSNMSGKSTLLRTVGTNVVLALAGAPVRARSLRLSPLAIGTSIQVQDSLAEGWSRFHAEITKLKRVLDLTAEPLPVLFLLDEILHGTNSHDRRVGAEAVIRGLLDRGAIGLVTTHDLALAGIAQGSASPQLRNVHFRDTIEDGRSRFDYRLHDGVVTRSNALDLMRQIGLDIGPA